MCPSILVDIHPLPSPLQYAPGPPIRCVLQGSNFGIFDPNSSWVAFASSDTPPNYFIAASSMIISWNHTAIVFFMPPGAGFHLAVTVSAGGQTQSPSWPIVYFDYDPPLLLAVGRSDRSLESCTSHLSCTSGFCKPVVAQCYDCAGGFQIQLVGQSFGHAVPGYLGIVVSVTIGGQPCLGVNATDDIITCTAPRYQGDQNIVVVNVAGRPSNAILFAYDPPVVNIIPSTPNANGQLIRFSGGVMAGDRPDTLLSLSTSCLHCRKKPRLYRVPGVCNYR